MNSKLIGELTGGPLDVIGDVHGEIGALQALLEKLGYDGNGNHSENRHLVFVGDLVDRGPDSLAVLECVMRLVANGKAQCVLGNHELNLLLDEEKHGNSWYVNPSTKLDHPARLVDPEQKARIHEFLSGLPITLARADLRVVHACWHPESIAQLVDDRHRSSSAIEIYRRYAVQLEARWEKTALRRKMTREAEEFGELLSDENWKHPTLLLAHAEMDTEHQMGNPIRVLTSGVEAPAEAPFWAGGKWRMAQRIKWWEEYDYPTPVIVGHYWRRYSDAQNFIGDKFGPDLFEGVEPHHWMGKRSNVYCVDFSVGGRQKERVNSTTPPYLCKLSALRVSEWAVMHDDGEVWQIGPPDSASA